MGNENSIYNRGSVSGSREVTTKTSIPHTPTMPVICWDPSISDIMANGGKIQ
jgi:hypothetical protein